jgi:transposase
MEDDEWAFIEPFLTAIRGRGGRPSFRSSPCARCSVLDCPHRFPVAGLPEEFGKWSSVYCQFRRWTLVIIPENHWVENWTSPAFDEHGEDDEDIKIYGKPDSGDLALIFAHQTPLHPKWEFI